MTRIQMSSLAIAGLLAALAAGPAAAQTAPQPADAHAGHAGHAGMAQAAPEAPPAETPACHGMDHSSMSAEDRAAMMERHQAMMAGMDHSTMSAEEHAAMKARHEAMMASCPGMPGMDHGAHHPAPEAAAEPAHQH